MWEVCIAEAFTVGMGCELTGVDEADVYALDEYISQEHEMEEALEELAPQNVPSSPRSERDSFYGDDDYDDIFMDLADNVDGAGYVQHNQDMDMSG